ncbi:LysR substrate-binding domain-containing protein [Shumkonia mesophila]|uniref:LysR substrate-binding domain-containing protein n=1 Tax=Shumkonia mesophila TaxID=2838854 RepID=UPI002934DE1C|nr:LysR substrate-binding domain-containing protein [Shumkonia mesophila]
MLLDSRRLLYFLRIAEFESFSQAAKSLHIAQPALSHHVRQLEESLGVSLFNRRSRGITLTEEGTALLHHARSIVSRIEDAENELRNRTLEVTGSITLGLASSIAAPLTPLLLNSVHSKHKGITLHLVEGTSAALAEWVISERLDMALNLEDVVEHRCMPLFNEDLYLVGPAGAFANDGATQISFKAATLRPLMLPARHHSMRMLIEREAVKRTLTIKTAYEIDGHGPLKAAIAAGFGHSILSWAAIQQECAAGLLSAARIVRPSLRRTMVLDMPTRGQPSRASLAIRTILHEIIAELFRSKTWHGQLRFQPGTSSE